jgi:hypothetical protein
MKAMSVEEEDRFLEMPDVNSHAEAMEVTHIHKLIEMTSHEKVEGEVVPIPCFLRPRPD